MTAEEHAMTPRRGRRSLIIVAIAVVIWAAYLAGIETRQRTEIPRAGVGTSDAAVSHLLAESDYPFALPPVVVYEWTRQRDRGRAK